ncbi:hypothetical protein ACFV98_39250 [Streptomyces violascens]|uniref:hypothetical protein n=1 Tax=Streptomyces violascens TaxID=67381 RepID=UPI00366116FE
MRDWLCRFNGDTDEVRSLFTAVLVSAMDDPVVPGAAGSRLADAVVAVLAAASGLAGSM